MAKDLNLRKYQEDILARLEALSDSVGGTSNSRLGISIGQDRVLVDLSEISEVLSLPELHKVPLTQSWFLGMANVRGNLYGISDLAQLAGQPATTKTSNSRVLLINQELAAQAGLVVDRLIGLRGLDQLKEKKSKKAKAFCFKPQTYEDSEGNTWLELDCHALVNSKEFMQPSIS